MAWRAEMARTRNTNRGRLTAVALVTAAVVECGDGNDGSIDPDPEPVTEPGSETQDTVRLREIGSCDEPGEAVGAYMSGFELYDVP